MMNAKNDGWLVGPVIFIFEEYGKIEGTLLIAGDWEWEFCQSWLSELGIPGARSVYVDRPAREFGLPDLVSTSSPAPKKGRR